MTPKTHKALEDSITHWKRIVLDPLGESIKVKYCALGLLYSTIGCSECPVFACRGKPYCQETPYDGFFKAVLQAKNLELQPDETVSRPLLEQLRKLANDELQFLISLREGE